MTRVVIIGGTGHVGTYLVPRMVAAGFEVVNVSRGARQPYRPHAAWRSVRTVKLDRDVLEACRKLRRRNPRARSRHRHRHDLLHRGECTGPGRCARRPGPAFPSLRHHLGARPERLRPDDRGGAAPAVRCLRRPESRDRGLSSSTPRAGRAFPPPSSIPAISSARAGRRSIRPAISILQCSAFWRRAGSWRCQPRHGDRPPRPCRRRGAGVRGRDRESQRGARRGVPRRFARCADPARLCRGDGGLVRPGGEADLSCRGPNGSAPDSELEAGQTWDHIAHSPNCSIAKAERLLGYRPRYSSLEAVRESVEWLIGQGVVKTG